MFVREKRVATNGREYTYLQIVENERDGAVVRQRLIGSLGNKDGLTPASVDGLLVSLARYGTLTPVPAGPSTPPAAAYEGDPGIGTREERRYGDLVALDRVWRDLGIRDLLCRLGSERRFEHDLERATFAMVANRLLEPSSKLRTETWLDEEAYLPLPQPLAVDQLYKTLCWLHEVKDELEVGLHDLLKRRRLTGGTVYFYDTTLTHFEGRGPEELAEVTGRRGALRGKPHLLVGLVTTSDGWPVMHHIYPGATNDVPTFKRTLQDMYGRFRFREVVVIADRGMQSEEVVRLLEAKDGYDFRYIVASRLRKVTEVDENVLARAGRYHEVEAGLSVKEVWVDDRRYVICRSNEAAVRDANRRQEIVSELEEKLGDGLDPTSKAAMKLRTSAYDRFLTVRNDRLVIDRSAVERDSRYDGKWVLRTNLRELDAAKIALRYKDESRIERDIRTIKSFLGLRPIHHYGEPCVAGHVFVCVLALLLHRGIQAQLGTWPSSRESVEEVLRTLSHIRAREHRLGREDADPTYFWSRSDLTAEQEALLRRFGISRLPRMLSAPPRLSPKKRTRTVARRHRRARQPRPAVTPDEEVLR
jgi:hypothetical protein